MALTELQRRVSRVIAGLRRDLGESYLAGGVALNEALRTRRLSYDFDLFHDTREAVLTSFEQDKRALESAGFSFELKRDLPGFMQALVRDSGDQVLVEWSHDSAYRFFPLQFDDDLGLVLHLIDLATNKVLALVGRVEVRDWVDILACHERLQPLGYLAWAASGKDPGLSPGMILEEAARTARYSAEEVAALAFDGPPPDPVVLSRQWRAALQEAREIVELLPADKSGNCVLDASGALFTGNPDELRSALADGRLLFHAGHIRGAIPVVMAT